MNEISQSLNNTVLSLLLTLLLIALLGNTSKSKNK